MGKIVFILSFLFLFIASCDRISEKALRQACHKRAEQENVLEHFIEYSTPLKYEGAIFLIENMPYIIYIIVKA